MSDLGFTAKTTSVDEAKAMEQSTGSKYSGLADQWREARESNEAIVIENVEKNIVENVRNFFYRTFDIEDVIVRSSKKEETNDEGEPLYNMTIREREGREYLQEGEFEDTEEVPEDAEETVSEDASSTSDDSGEETEDEEEFESSGLGL